MTGPQKGVVNAGGTVKLSSNEVDSDRINLYINAIHIGIKNMEKLNIDTLPKKI